MLRLKFCVSGAMGLPQGINFRATAGYVTDGGNEDNELVASGNQTYPHTTAQGINVGWETVSGLYQGRNRNAGNDRRLAGINFNTNTGTWDFRVDLPSAGTYNIRLAMGDASYAAAVACDIVDGTTNLGTLTSGSTSAFNQFKDPTNTEYSAANWPGSNTAVSKTFSTTICRVRVGSAGSGSHSIAHFYIESGGPNNAVFYLRA